MYDFNERILMKKKNILSYITNTESERKIL